MPIFSLHPWSLVTSVGHILIPRVRHGADSLRANLPFVVQPAKPTVLRVGNCQRLSRLTQLASEVSLS